MNENSPIELFDTTLRDGTQGEGISLSVDDKIHIAKHLDDFGIDFIEGGWPGSNPKDEAFFRKIKNETLTTSTICAFGSTARFPKKIESDTNLIALLKAETSTVCIFGKSWNLHADVGLGLSKEANEDLIYKSIQYLINNGLNTNPTIKPVAPKNCNIMIIRPNFSKPNRLNSISIFDDLK